MNRNYDDEPTRRSATAFKGKLKCEVCGRPVQVRHLEDQQFDEILCRNCMSDVEYINRDYDEDFT